MHILRELVYSPDMLGHDNFAVEVVLTEEEEQQVYDSKARRGRGGWRRRQGRHLISVLERLRINAPEDLWRFVSGDLRALLRQSNWPKPCSNPSSWVSS